MNHIAETPNHITTPKILVNRKELASMLSLGTVNADKVGTQANAVVRFGKRKLYNVQKIQAYIDAK